MLFVDFSSASNTSIPIGTVNKLLNLGVNKYICRWIITDQQTFMMGSYHWAILTLSTGGVPQGCVLSPVLYTYNCTPSHGTNLIIKFADRTTVVALIRNNESTHRDEVQKLRAWCAVNDLELNHCKTTKLISGGGDRNQLLSLSKETWRRRSKDFKFLDT